METNEISPKDESKEKLILLEALLSKSIISFMWFFSTNNIAENVDLDKKTINSHKATGIPPKYFGLYVEALGKCSRPSLEMQEILKSKPHAAESCKILTQIIYRCLSWQYTAYRKLVGAAPYILDRVSGKETAHDEDVLEILLEQLEKSTDFIRSHITQNKIENLSPQFLYRVNICFDAFSTITYVDFLFLPTFFRASSERKEEILTKINKMALNPVTDIVSCLTSGDGKPWIIARNHYYTNKKSEMTSDDIWKKLSQKIEGRFRQAKSIEEQKNVLAFCSFLALIWPEEGETDTKFGTKEIEALIVFKYCLTKEARQNLLDELEI